MSPTQPDLPKIESARVLVVEDESIIAKDIELSLKGLGYRVCGSADTGPDALEKAERTKPDVVLMDIRLRGDMDGIEAARLIHERLHVPVVFLTAYADEPTLRRAEAALPFGYVLKPFEERDLHVALVMALCRHKAYAEVEQRVQERTRQLARSEEELREALRAREEFLAIASHELKTPLAALLMQVQGLERSTRVGELSPKLRERLSKASAAGERLERLIDEMLDLSRISAGRLKLQPERVNLDEAVREVVDRFAEPAARVNVSITLHLQPGVAGLWDKARLEQVVNNLLSNAIKYGKGKPVEIKVHTEEDHAILEVRDHGIGIARDQQRKIFERFERAHATREYGGLGLGLWIAWQIVEASGGRIEVQSTPGQGAVFTVRLPLRPQEGVPHALQ